MLSSLFLDKFNLSKLIKHCQTLVFYVNMRVKVGAMNMSMTKWNYKNDHIIKNTLEEPVS